MPAPSGRPSEWTRRGKNPGVVLKGAWKVPMMAHHEKFPVDLERSARWCYVGHRDVGLSSSVKAVWFHPGLRD